MSHRTSDIEQQLLVLKIKFKQRRSSSALLQHGLKSESKHKFTDNLGLT